MGALHKKFHKGTTFGIEYTYVFKENPRDSTLIEAFVALINYDFKKKGMRAKSHYDGGAVEINSPPFATLNQAKKFYDVMDEIVDKYPLIARPEVKDMVCGGGGHIHMKPPLHYPRSRAILYSKLARFLTLHPYIAWVFQEWGDSETALNFNDILWNKKDYPLGGIQHFNGMDPVHNLTLPNKYDMIRKEFNPCHLSQCMSNKNRVLRYDDDPYTKPLTFEFRAFDSKESFRDVEDHINFVNSMVAHVDKQRSIPVSPYNNKDAFLALGKKDRGIDGFRKVIRTLDLPQRRYERFYSNFYLRAKHGKLV